MPNHGPVKPAELVQKASLFPVIASVICPAILFPLITNPSFAMYSDPKILPAVIAAHVGLFAIGVMLCISNQHNKVK